MTGVIGEGFWIRTGSGRAFDFLEPTEDMIDPHDIVSASARLFRFTGHGARHPLDLNQHHRLVASITSKLISQRYGYAHELTEDEMVVTRSIRRASLVHDVHEVYVGDVSRPLKQAMRAVCGGALSPYDAIEEAAQLIAFERFGVPIEYARHDLVKAADNMALAYEARWLFGETWGLDLPPWRVSIEPPDVAAHFMLDTLLGLAAERDSWRGDS